MALSSFGEHRDACDDIDAGLEVAEWGALAAAALVAGTDAAHAAVGDEQLLGGCLGKKHGASLFRLLGEPPAELREGGNVVAVVLHRRRRRNPDRAVRREEVDGF